MGVGVCNESTYEVGKTGACVLTCAGMPDVHAQPRNSNVKVYTLNPARTRLTCDVLRCVAGGLLGNTAPPPADDDWMSGMMVEEEEAK